jgi:hypothetical protein
MSGAPTEEAAPALVLPAGEKAARGIEYGIIGLAASGLEAHAFAELIAETWSLGEWALAHAATSAAVALWLILRRREGTGRRAALLLVLSVVFCGPFGGPGALLSALAHRWFRRHATPLEEWYAALFPAPEKEPARDLYDMIVSGRDLSKQSGVASFTDVLATGTTEQKRATITLMTRFFRPAFAPALKRALADAEPAIRVQAATAAAEIENSFQERAQTLAEAVKAEPKNAARHFDMARHYDDYAYSGLLDVEREAENRNLALEAYMRCLDLDPENSDALAAVGRILLRKGEFHEAATVLGDAVSGGRASPAMLDFYIEALFRLGDYTRLREILRVRGGEILNDPARPAELRSAIDLWAAQGRLA